MSSLAWPRWKRCRRGRRRRPHTPGDAKGRRMRHTGPPRVRHPHAHTTLLPRWAAQGSRREGTETRPCKHGPAVGRGRGAKKMAHASNRKHAHKGPHKLLGHIAGATDTHTAPVDKCVAPTASQHRGRAGAVVCLCSATAAARSAGEIVGTTDVDAKWRRRQRGSRECWWWQRLRHRWRRRSRPRPAWLDGRAEVAGLTRA